MTLPEGVRPSGPTEPAATIDPTPEPTPAPADLVPAAESAPAAEEEPPAVPEEAPAELEDTSAEDASDAELRAWAKENGIEDVPGSGRLSAAWREQITATMTAALDPKEEGSVEDISSDSSTSTEMTMEESGSPEELVEYRSVWQAPETWVTGQAYTA